MHATASETFRPDRVAAIVYDDGVAVDHLMLTFAQELVGLGTDICGILQLPPDGPECGPGAPMRLQDLRTGEVLPICLDTAGGSDCKLDVSRLADAAGRLRTAAEGRSELLFISKFGKQEIQGRGFRAEMALAASEGRTILTAVKRGLVHNWLDFTGGMGTLLDHRLWVLRDWWNDVSKGAYGRPGATQH